MRFSPDFSGIKINHGASMYFAIEGVIGVGKTTLARLLQEAFDAQLQLEVFEENPFLKDFYSDRARYAFQTQIFFLLSRYHQQRRIIPEVIGENRNLITDYTFEKDALFARINLAGDELEMYYRVHEALAEKIPLPNLVVYLRASTDTLMQRIAFRDRHYERQMERDYIAQLNEEYDNTFLKGTQPVPVITIETDLINFVSSRSDLFAVEGLIRSALLTPPLQPSLPLPPADAAGQLSIQ
jgi:deoxyguanosine kinase